MNPLRKLREAAGLSQAAVANAVGVQPRSVRRWESGTEVGTAHLRALAVVLGATPEELVEALRGRPATLHDLREVAGLSTLDVARALSLSRGQVQRLHRGACALTKERIDLLAGLYGVSPAQVAAAALRVVPGERLPLAALLPAPVVKELVSAAGPYGGVQGLLERMVPEFLASIRRRAQSLCK